MKGLYSVAKIVVDKKKNINDKLKPFFIVSLYCLLCKYRNNPEIVCDTFLKTTFIIEDIPLRDILLEKGLGSILLSSNSIQNTDGIEGISIPSSKIRIYKDQGFEIIENDPIIVCSTYKKSIEESLNSFCHEMGHQIKNQLNSIQHKDNDDTYECVLRSGMYLKRVTVDKDDLSTVQEEAFNILEEVINTIQTTEALEYLSSLKNIDVDDNVLDLINRINYRKLKKDYGYDLMVKLFRKLWDDDKFRLLIENNIIEGNIEDIVENFDSFADNPNLLRMIADTLDKIDLTYNESKIINIKRLSLIRKYNKLSKIYLDKTE